MMNLLFLAWRQVVWNWWKSLLLVLALSLLIFAPVASHQLLLVAGREWQARAETTPLLIGARGSRTDLVLHALYFTRQPDSLVRMGDVDAINESGHGLAVPVYIRHTAGGFPVIGTTLDYLNKRGLKIAAGNQLTMLGDCILGHEAARRLGVGPGDRLVSDPENVFDIAGSEPLRMNVAGVLAPTGTPEDRAVLVDIRTAWIISGIGHGHDDLETTDDPDAVLSREDRQITASGALRTYQEITPENIHTFHFHGEPEDMPVTAVLVFPRDERGRTILRGRYQSERQPLQAIVPTHAMEELLDQVLRHKRLLDGFVALLSVAMAALLVVVILLSLRLRQREFQVLETLGCARRRMLLLPVIEWLIHLCLALTISGVLLLLMNRVAPWLIRFLVQ
ncbi:MAG: ABC transporter permease [Candidatus Sumerlaeia bacterium]|nr:ABC transporter permease [Candidatus Sumerlaeia bacterium]